MKIPQCHREQEVLDAVRSGRWSGPWGDDLRNHAAGCVVCAEVAMVAELLLDDGALAQDEAQVPGAGLVWWKAQRAARRAAEERATQPIALVERFSRVLVLLCALGVAFWQWPRIAAWLGVRSLGQGHIASAEWTDRIARLLQSFAQGLGGESSGYLVIATAGALLALMAFATYIVLREE
jgi:hypothetical protein